MLVAGVGPLLVTGSFVSGLMSWRGADMMVLAGRDFSPQDVTGLMARVVTGRGSPGWSTAVLRIKDYWHRQPA